MSSCSLVYLSLPFLIFHGLESMLSVLYPLLPPLWLLSDDKKGRALENSETLTVHHAIDK